MTKWLYGASVQGIQSFIFGTNKLVEIVGASKLVDSICTIDSGSRYFASGKGQKVVSAAGKVQFIFGKKVDCEKAVQGFPRSVMERAPGITISQAVVEYGEGAQYGDYSSASNELERRLRTQRNRPQASMTVGMAGILRSRRTGLPAIDYEKEGPIVEPIDEATSKKREIKEDEQFRLFEEATGEKMKHETFAHEIEDITDKNSWIAIIHADGNGLGQVVQKVASDEKKMREFSERLDEATKNAARAAYEKVVKGEITGATIPFRPIVLGGDDLTVIIRGDLAVEYTSTFLEEFEKQTGTLLGKEYLGNVYKEHCLTACAGIAFVKSSFPFYYGYELAEALCGKAKDDCKNAAGGNLPASCLMFHKVQDSFVEDYKEIEKRELEVSKSGISLKGGPYYVGGIKMPDERKTVETLKGWVKELEGKEGNAVKSGLRLWLSALYVDKSMADQRLNRLKEIAKDYKELIEQLTNKEEKRGTVTAYDVMTLLTIMNQKTR